MTNGELVARSQQRVGDVEREAAVERLRTAAGEGRLTLDELDGRLESALVARTFADLDVLTADLPDAGPAGPRPEQRESVRLAVRHGRLERRANWHIPRTVQVEAAHSCVTLDLRTAPLPVGGLRLEIDSRHSTIILLAPAAMLIESDEVSQRHAQIRDRRGRRVREWSGRQVFITGTLHHSVLKIKRPR
jgi:uncharacterized protein DUF1707